MRKIVIAIDGTSACGKSVTASRVARILGYFHFDSGAMYRAVTVYFLNHHIITTDSKMVASALSRIDITFRINTQVGTTEIYLNGINVEGKIRKTAVSEQVSHVSALKEVRDMLVKIQRRLGKNKGIVMDGRDIGTTVFPQAELKVFMTADLATRSLRRQNELQGMNLSVSLNEITNNIKKRDRYDSARKVSPLRKADDAILFDTTYCTIDEQVDEIVRLAIAKIIINHEG